MHMMGSLHLWDATGVALFAACVASDQIKTVADICKYSRLCTYILPTTSKCLEITSHVLRGEKLKEGNFNWAYDDCLYMDDIEKKGSNIEHDEFYYDYVAFSKDLFDARKLHFLTLSTSLLGLKSP